MTAAQEVIEIRPQIELVDVEAQFIGIDRIFRALDGIVIAVITRRRGKIKLVVKDVFPLQRYILIGVSISRIVVEIETVFTHVTGQVEVVLLVDLMRDIQIEIVKAGAAVLILRRQVLQEPVGISGPTPDYKAGLVLDQWSLDVDPAG